RGGRRTARGTSTASTRRRTSSATRSSPRSPTTSSPSPGSARAERPAPERRVSDPSNDGGRFPPPRPPSTLRELQHALVRPSPRLLRLRALGRADDQLPAPALDAGGSDRRPPPTREPVADLREPGNHQGLPDAARRR